MDIAIAGGHGKISMQLGRILSAQGHRVRGLIRDPEQADDLLACGVEPVLCDLEGDDDVAEAVHDAGAIVFAAGAGAGSGSERKRTMDLGGVLKLIDAAKAGEIRRYLMVSSMGADSPPPEGGDVFGEYLRAKAEADRALFDSGLDYTVIRPGMLTDEPPTGRVTIGSSVGRAEVSRADVAAVLAASLLADNTIGKTFELIEGDAPINEAIAEL